MSWKHLIRWCCRCIFSVESRIWQCSCSQNVSSLKNVFMIWITNPDFSYLTKACVSHTLPLHICHAEVSCSKGMQAAFSYRGQGLFCLSSYYFKLVEQITAGRRSIEVITTIIWCCHGLKKKKVFCLDEGQWLVRLYDLKWQIVGVRKAYLGWFLYTGAVFWHLSSTTSRVRVKIPDLKMHTQFKCCCQLLRKPLPAVFVSVSSSSDHLGLL